MKILFFSFTCEDVDVVMVTNMSANNIRASRLPHEVLRDVY